MNDEFIQKIADKLGVTIEHLWSVLIQQAYIDAMISTMCVIFWVVVITVVFKLLKKHNQDGDAEWYYEVWGLYGFISLMILGILLNITGNVITCLINPEYWALMQIKP